MNNRLVQLVLLLLSSLVVLSSSASGQEYILLGWNDLGMHCSNKNFSKVVVLPPYNNVHAQLILKQPGEFPQILTTGYTVEYSIPNNTYSVGKTDFWTYAQQLFGLASPLPANVGLTGNGLTGSMSISGNFFEVTGIPVTPYPDSDLVNEHPYQLIHLVAKARPGGNVVATTDVVIPVSNEVGCVQSGCHNSEQSILNNHEDVDGFNSNGPVLCASCHASNALGTPGDPEAKSFSYRMHNQHKSVAGPDNSTATCYKCHPGPNTQCLRDIMGKVPANPMTCQSCHGTMSQVASSISAGRRPWLDEPQCGNAACHGSTYAEETGKLFRNSEGHGGLFCSACHGSPHAIQPTVEGNDNLQNIRLQGFAGTLQTCSVCHATPPTSPGPHGIMNTQVAPEAPVLALPPDVATGISVNPTLQWDIAAFASSYHVEVALDPIFIGIAVNESLLTATSIPLSMLNTNTTYYWRVQAKNAIGTSPWSGTWSFTTSSTLSFAVPVQSMWNLLSLPARVDDPSITTVFPGASSAAFGYTAAQGYQTEDSAHQGIGYWLKFPSARVLDVAGFTVLDETLDVAEGWNLIGGISVPVPVSAITTIPSGIIDSKFFGFEGNYRELVELSPGKAYWIKTRSAGKLILRTP
jgi:hypothetical protein